MTELVCEECGATVRARSRFEAEGECPECGADAGCLVEQDAYDQPERELACNNCGFAADAAVVDEQTRATISVDDPCPICEEALVPARHARSPRDVPEYKLARFAAAKLRRQHGHGTPVEVEQIAAAVGLTVVRGAYAHDGLLAGETIEVPATHATVVQRFVIAHEIGHHELRHTGGRDKIEPEANAFASELLIDPAALRAEVITGASVPALARRFQVSRQALVYALMAHKLIASIGKS